MNTFQDKVIAGGHYTHWYEVFHNTQREVIWSEEFSKSMHRDKSAKMAIWQKIATLQEDKLKQVTFSKIIVL